jgi:hypothetical protein
MSTKTLEAKVKAVNRANEYAAQLYPTLANFFWPYTGVPITKDDGSLLKKVAKFLPPFRHDSGLMVYRLTSGYHLAWVVKTNEQIEGAQCCVYHETTIYVGKVEGNVLTEIMPWPNQKLTYTVDEVIEARRQYEAAKKAADEARNALWPFGETDR